MADPNAKDLGRSIFSAKGTAAPSPEVQKAPAQKPPWDPASELANSTDKYRTNDLSGLIKRTNPQPAQPPRQPVRPVGQFRHADFSEVKRRTVEPEALLPEFKVKTVSIRRQLTLRIDMKKFSQLDRLAKTSGRTYQDILSEALDQFFRSSTD